MTETYGSDKETLAVIIVITNKNNVFTFLLTVVNFHYTNKSFGFSTAFYSISRTPT